MKKKLPPFKIRRANPHRDDALFRRTARRVRVRARKEKR
jgi:hypothetical protein